MLSRPRVGHADLTVLRGSDFSDCFCWLCGTGDDLTGWTASFCVRRCCSGGEELFADAADVGTDGSVCVFVDGAESAPWRWVEGCYSVILHGPADEEWPLMTGSLIVDRSACAAMAS